MNKIFCVACGHKNIYEVSQPKFCASCGAGIVGSSNSSVSGREKVLEPSVEVELEESKVGGFDIDRLRRQIVAESNSSKIKLGDIMGSAVNNNDDGEFSRSPSNLPDGKDLLEKSRKDCGSAKSPNIVEGE